ncbi:MAG: hypothetical protein C4534_00860 [Gaiellales bacterium]|nr:MAG: hypothetical protein C4534_00860 [Gaiellales bacterium]
MGTRLDTRGERAEQAAYPGRKYRVTAFTTTHKIVGTAFAATGDYDPSWRTSDFLRSFDGDRMVLGDVEIRDVKTGTIVDKPEYVMLSLRSVEMLYAEELGVDALV